MEAAPPDVEAAIAKDDLLSALHLLHLHIAAAKANDDMKRQEVLRELIIRCFYSLLSQPYSEEQTDGRLTAFIRRMTAEDFVEHAATPLSREALIRFLVHLKHAFPDWTFRLEQIMVFPDLSVVVRGVQEGTHKGSYMVSSATDRHVSLPFLAVHHFKEALLADRYYTLDHLSLLSQLRVHRVYPLDYEFFVPAELQLARLRTDAASNVEICSPFSQVVARGVDFALQVRLVGEKADGQRVKVVLLDQQGVLLPKYRKKERKASTGAGRRVGADLLSGGGSTALDSMGVANFTLRLNERASSSELYRLGILLDHQLRIKSLPLKIPRSGSTTSKTAGKTPELLYAWPSRAPIFGDFPNDTGRRMTLVGRRLHLSREMRCRIGKETFRMPMLVFSAADVLHVDAPVLDAPDSLTISVVNDSTLTSNDLTIDLYSVSAKTLPVLHAACLNGEITAVKNLCKEGGLAATHDTAGHSALYWAVHGNHVAVAEYLVPLIKGLQLDASASDGETALLLASRLGSRALVKLCIGAGMAVGQKDKRGDTPLIHACKGGFEGVAEELIASEADVDQKDARGHTPIAYAALLAPYSRTHARIELLLRDKGAVIEGDALSGQRKTTRQAEDLLRRHTVDPFERGSLKTPDVVLLSTLLRGNNTLQILDISGNVVGAAASEALADALSANSTLAELYAADANLGDAGLRVLAKVLRTHSALRVLDLAGNGLSCEACEDIAKLIADNRAIVELDLGRNDAIGDKGATAIAAALVTNQSLRLLYLGQCGIGSDGEAAIARTKLTNPVKRTFYIRPHEPGANLMPQQMMTASPQKSTPVKARPPGSRIQFAPTPGSSLAETSEGGTRTQVLRQLDFSASQNTATINTGQLQLKNMAKGLDLPDNLDDLDI